MYTALITASVSLIWGGCPVSWQPGDLVILAPGSALESAIGLGNIVNCTGSDQNVPSLASGASN